MFVLLRWFAKCEVSGCMLFCGILLLGFVQKQHATSLCSSHLAFSLQGGFKNSLFPSAFPLWGTSGATPFNWTWQVLHVGKVPETKLLILSYPTQIPAKFDGYSYPILIEVCLFRQTLISLSLVCNSITFHNIMNKSE